MKILLTNDDGIYAPGLRELARHLAVEHEVTVVAPDSERSAVSHGLTIRNPLFVTSHKILDLPGFAVSGTPADCVKLGIDSLMLSAPDLVISGINSGANTGLNVFYSGTVAAAIEATFLGIPAMALSIDSFSPNELTDAAQIASGIVREFSVRTLSGGIVLNINFPNLPKSMMKGIRITRQSRVKFHDTYLRRESPNGTPYYWLDGDHPEQIEDLNDDEYALKSGWVTVTPLSADFNAADSIFGDMAEWIASTNLLEKFCSAH